MIVKLMPHLVKVCLNMSGSRVRPLSARERLTRLAARLWRLRLPPLASWLWSRSRLESLT